MTNRVDIYTNYSLYVNWCATSRCVHRDACNPVAYEGEEGYELRIIGQMIAEECPIMARLYGDPGWISAENHTGKCGYHSNE